MERASAEAARAAREGALLVEHSRRGTLRATGPDRRSWLNGLLSCDVADVAKGGLWGLALTKTGKIMSDVFLLEADDEVFLSIAPQQAAPLFEFLDHHLIMEDAELEDVSEQWTWVSLHGPRAVELARSLEAPAHSASLDFSGLGGALVLLPTSSASEHLERLQAEGTAVRATAADWAALRVERSIPEWGQDYDAGQNPHEVGLAHRAVSWTKGCYLGQEVVCMQDMRGKLRKQLAALSLDASSATTGDEVLAEAAGVGELKTVIWSAQLERPVALARMKTKSLEGEVALVVGGAAAQVLRRPV